MNNMTGNDEARLQRRLEAIKLQEIEGNPFTPEDNALFEMFDREGWTDEQRRTYIVRAKDQTLRDTR